MSNSIEQFFCNEGSLAFIIPFSLNNECQKLFFDGLKEKATSEDCYKIKNKIVEQIRQLQGLFSHASTYYENYARCKENCPCYDEKDNKSNDEPQRRSLCRGLSISRNFHDDQAQDTPRFDVFLGTYNVLYRPTSSNSDFSFHIDASLLLTTENNGDKMGYVLFNILLSSIRDNLIIAKDNELDKLIFVKHLFYKNKLKCIIDNHNQPKDSDEPYQLLSLQEWTTGVFLPELFDSLKMSYKDNHLDEYVNKYVNNNGAFRYSIIELDNVRDGSPQENVINIEIDKKIYANQIYGLLVGDEGWRFFPKKEISHKCAYWSSRNFTYSFFIEHNALIIKQYDEKYIQSSGEWFKHYPNEGYHEYPLLKTCIPGVSSLTFDAFLTSVYKEFIIERAEDQYKKCGNNPDDKLKEEDKLKDLEILLQNYSMSLDEIKNVEDIICSQFDVPFKLRNIQQLYQRQANNVKNEANRDQNTNIQKLTKITLNISLATFVTTLVSVSLVILGYSLQNEPLGISYVLPYPEIVILIIISILIYFLLKKYLNKGTQK